MIEQKEGAIRFSLAPYRIPSSIALLCRISF
jgi:hypothetical protein